MDRIGLEILRQELAQDAAVLAQAAQTAAERLRQDNPGHLEACGFELHRAYGVLEKSLERICLAFENHLDQGQRYHERLIERMRLDLPGIRPVFLPAGAEPAVHDLKGFRHVFRHSYDLPLRADRLEGVVESALWLAGSFPTWCDTFLVSIDEEMDGF